MIECYGAARDTNLELGRGPRDGEKRSRVHLGADCRVDEVLELARVAHPVALLNGVVGDLCNDICISQIQPQSSR